MDQIKIFSTKRNKASETYAKFPISNGDRPRKAGFELDKLMFKRDTEANRLTKCRDH